MRKFEIGIIILMIIFTFIGINQAISSQYGNLARHEVRLIGNNTFLAGSMGAYRVITFDPASNKGIPGIAVKIYLNYSEKNKNDQNNYRSGIEVFSGRTDKTGSLNAKFKVPSDNEGTYKLVVVTGYDKNEIITDTEISIVKQFKIYLTTDKPLYQPGQIINIRALSLNLPGLDPVSEKEVIIEVMDGKGNKVFKQKGKTSKFGIASAKFQLADEVNMGDYHINAYIEKETAEKTVTVKKYVLPKYKIVFTKDKKFYTPGEILKGDLQVDYFFGKPVSNGKVLVKLSTFDFEFKQVAEIKGNTDKNGHFTFEMKLPDYLVGQPLDKGGAAVLLDLEVIDNADHKEISKKMIPVSKDALKIQFYP